MSELNGWEPLNRELYQRLQDRFGSVKVANPGIPMATSPVPSLITGQIRNAIVTAGETYRVSCCFCGDTGHRLWIGYLYGQASAEGGGRSETWLANCFHNEGACLADPARRHALEYRIFGFRNRADRSRVVPIQAGNWQLVEELASATVPGEVVLLSQLPAGHPARQYLVGRGYDPDQLSIEYGVGFCVRPSHLFAVAGGRIIIPIFMYNQLVGWQARAIGREEPKYWNRPGMPKSRMLYNFDRAAQWPFVIVTEGAAKVWRIGGPTVALFGKSLNYYQQALLSQQWNGKPIILLLDQEARDNMIGIVRDIERLGAVQLIPAYLPPGMPDPDECEHETICSFIRAEAWKKGVELPVW